MARATQAACEKGCRSVQIYAHRQSHREPVWYETYARAPGAIQGVCRRTQPGVPQRRRARRVSCVYDSPKPRALSGGVVCVVPEHEIKYSFFQTQTKQSVPVDFTENTNPYKRSSSLVHP